jgi:1,4-alpha-glucan branching enzyme
MKKKLSTPTPEPGLAKEAAQIPVHFEFTHPTARAVSIAGTFNKWESESIRLAVQKGGHWIKEIPMTPGTYEYCLIVDGEWITDPLNPATIENAYGGRNSLLTVSHSDEVNHLVDAQYIPLEPQSTK